MLLHRRDPNRHMARFYRLRLQPRLWGGVALVREWGRIGSPGRLRADAHDSTEAAERAGERLMTVKRRRGYSDA